MNRYLKLVDEILMQTHEGCLRWQQVANEDHARKICEPWKVLRQFETPFFYNGSQAILICVEKGKYVDEDYLFPYEDRMCELLILVDGDVPGRA